MFSDTLQIYLNDDSEVKLLNTGIAWSTDRSTKYKNPPGSNFAQGKKISKFTGLSVMYDWKLPCQPMLTS